MSPCGSASDKTLVFGHDGHGSVTVLYDLSSTAINAVQAIATYAAYGVLLATHNGSAGVHSSNFTLQTSLGYSGELWDAASQQQYLRARYYNPTNGQFNRLDPFVGDLEDPQSLHKYAYVHGDPINGIDPTGMFLGTAIGLGSMLGSTGIGMGARGANAGASLSALNAVHKAVKLYEFLSWITSFASAGTAMAKGDYGKAIEALIGVNPNEFDKIKNEIFSALKKGGINNIEQINKQTIGLLPKIDLEFSLPGSDNNSRKKGRIGKALGFIENIIGKSRLAQEVIGEVGTLLVAKIIGFGIPALERAHASNGPDFILRHSKQQDLWAIAEAKGGSSGLGTSRLVKPNRPAGFSLLPGEGPKFQQMGARWIEFWLRHTIDKNAFSDDGRDLSRSFRANDPMLAMVVSLDLSRTKEIHIGMQPFVPPKGTLFKRWTGF